MDSQAGKERGAMVYQAGKANPGSQEHQACQGQVLELLLVSKETRYGDTIWAVSNIYMFSALLKHYILMHFIS